jgi:small subunit ribosomal protein S8
MTMTDPVADMLTRIRNANTAMHDTVVMPGSKLKTELAAILAREGYIESFEKSDLAPKPGSRLSITLKYTPARERTISGVRRVSKPGRRVYSQAEKLPRVLGGMGIAIVSTPKGLMTDREARKNHLGGEVLCYVW